jgi:hypothetical protein
MAARRLIIILVLLLAVSVAAAALAPERGGETTITEDPETSTAEEARSDDAGELVERGILASPEDPETIRLEAGDRLSLSVSTREPREIEIAEFGLIANADPVAPAEFDIVTTEAAEAPITDAGSGEVLGQILIAEGKTEPK